MPRCQRTFRRLDSRGADRSGSWVCPICKEQETYQKIYAPDLRQYAAAAEASCRDFFQIPEDGRRADLYLGLFPECVFEPEGRRYDIYLQHDSDSYQLRLQIGHEIFHRVCSQGTIYHWTHEMFACLFSVWFLGEAGFVEYKEQMDQRYILEAADMSLPALTGVNFSVAPYPRGAYGRAYVTGKTLDAIVGREKLAQLVRCLDRAGNPDPRQWINSLSLDQAFAVRWLTNMEP